MRLNRYVEDSEIPGVLKGRLYFGNRQQIDALRQVDQLIEKRMTEKAMRDAGELKEYWVTVEVEGSFTEKVWAVSEHDACEKLEDVTLDEMDLDYHTSAMLVKKMKTT